MVFGQVIIGPPGSGKTTYTRAVAAYLRASGRRVAVVNLDPDNDVLPYEPDVDVSELVCLEQRADLLAVGSVGHVTLLDPRR